jgi:hypothetical protein
MMGSEGDTTMSRTKDWPQLLRGRFRRSLDDSGRGLGHPRC